MTTDPVALELAHRMPWLSAEGESWWLVTGTYGGGDTFHNCVAQVVPEMITGCEVGESPLFEVHVWGDKPKAVPANRITRAKRLVFTFADDPLRAYYPDEQVYMDVALARRDEETR